MDKVLALVLLTALSTCVVAKSGHPVTDSLRKSMAVALLKSKNNTNTVVSPLELRFQLCKLASVAQGKTKKELMSVLGMTKSFMIQRCYSDLNMPMTILRETDLTRVNKIYVNYSDNIDTNFMVNSSWIYGIDINKISFNYPSAAAAFINRLVSSATYKRIRDIVEPKDIEVNASMMFVSAAHFKSSWESPFNIKWTTLGQFRHSNLKISTVPFMNKQEEILYHSDIEYKYMTMKLRAMGTSLTLVIPESVTGIPNFLEKLSQDPDAFKKIQSQMSWRYVKISIPRFKIKSTVELSSYLKMIGLKRIFDSNSTELNKILKTNHGVNVCLSKAKQKNFIEIDEMGVFRHVDDDLKIMPTIPPYTKVNLPEVIADRSFFFTVSITLGDVVQDMFTGAYYGPE